MLSPYTAKKVQFTEDLVPKVKKPEQRITLDNCKLYLDSCATYHSAFVEECLNNIHDMDMVLKGSCKADITTSSEKGLAQSQQYCKPPFHPST